MPDDPVIQRIRDARRQIQEECGNDVHRMSLFFMEEQKKYADRLVCWNAQKTRLIPSKAKRGKRG